MNNNMTTSLTMNSLEIAEMVGSNHSDVKRSIRRLADSGVISLPPEAQVKVQRTRRKENVEVYVFIGEKGKRDSLVVVAQLSPEFTGALVDRWQELEKQLATPQEETALTSFDKQIALDEAAGRMLRMADSSKLGMLKEVARYNGVDARFLPTYSIDAPESEMGAGSSLPTKSLSALLKDHEVGVSAVVFNRWLEEEGYEWCYEHSKLHLPIAWVGEDIRTIVNYLRDRQKEIDRHKKAARIKRLKEELKRLEQE